jgi:hypothetical protein
MRHFSFPHQSGHDRVLLGDAVVVSAEVVAQEELVALGARHDCVAAPDQPDAQLVLGIIGIADRELEILRFQAPGDVGGDRLRIGCPGRLGLASDLERALLEPLNCGKNGIQPIRAC